MNFKKLSLIGFKSFANKLEIKFGEGITAIVGPNGCGKSNVADAVRWVLGEQSAKLLRGSKMMDVIFNGSKKRKALSYAEVSLTFDNHNRSLFPSYEYEEVVISRKLFRSGESEYYRNGSICKLRDISEMLRDAGFAIEGYTIIGQGRVMEIINAKPEDRRAVFEEAAGITKYKFKKIEAERKNARTRENLTRLNDILVGLKDQLGPLSRAAEKTRTYKTLKEQLKRHEVNIYINKFETASETKDKLSDVIADFDAQIAEKQRLYDEATAAYSKAMSELQNIDVTLGELHDELTELTVGQEKIEGKINENRVRYDLINNQNKELMATNAALTDNYNAILQAEKERERELRDKSAALKDAREAGNALNSEYMQVSERVVIEENKINAARRAMLDAMERRAAVNLSVGELSAERTAIVDQIETIKARISDNIARYNATSADITARTSELRSLDSDRTELLAQREKAESDAAACAARIVELNKSLDRAGHEAFALNERKKMNEEVKKNSYSYAVQKLLEAAEYDIRINTAIVGVIGRVITVKEGFEMAIETVLGAAVNNIVTKNEEDASYLIDYLKKINGGRATFLPLTSFKQHSIDPSLMHLLKRPGCFGVATDVITYDKVFDPAIKGLLGATVVVDNKDTAIALARAAKYAFRIVTLDGDFIAPQGSMTGGSKKLNQISLFEHERKQKVILADIEKTNELIKKLQSEHDTVTAQNDKLVRLVRECSQDIHDYELTIAAKTAENNALIGELKTIADGKVADEYALQQLSARLDEIVADLDAVEKTQDDVSAAARNEESERINKEFEALRSTRDALHEKVVQSNLTVVTLERDVEALEVDINRLRAENVAIAQRIDNNTVSIRANTREMQDCDEKIKSLTERAIGGNVTRCDEIRNRLGGLSQYKAELNDTTVRSDAARMQYSNDISLLVEQKHEQEILLTQVDVNMDNMQQTVLNNYGLDYNACLEFKEDNYDPEAGEIEVAKINRRIQYLGGINETAIEESQALAQKVDDLQKQCDDMYKSLQDEETIIKEMSANMMRDFNACFEQIRVNFRDIFRELFNGGHADLELTENEDPLQRGVEIIAQPPNKNLQSISLFSGGEKTLTAIAIMFAIIKMRPMPFCFLDEIEAALDDANVGRVASMIKKFSATTQFIVITHRKPTMEQADCLYGVTMEEEGVSTIVSVRLSDALQNAVTISKQQND